MKTTKTIKKGPKKWTTHFDNSDKRGTYESDPVLLFDKMPSSSNPTIGLLTTDEVANMLNVSVTTVRRLQQGRHVPFLKIGGSIRFAKSDLMSYLEKMRVEALG